ncbi:MAG TPA: hypothetical protein VFQ61_34210, partial [Polyangiaceae bacterium]|nr:hypothetical protein [Polyangiaceae bacterium]
FAAQFRALGAELLAYPDGDPSSAAQLAEVCRGTDVVLQATSAGMHGTQGGDALAALVPFESLPAHALAYDLVYNPRQTPFLRAAAARGLEARHGLGMLVRQASLAMELWLGKRPSFETLYHAADTALGRPNAPSQRAGAKEAP